MKKYINKIIIAFFLMILSFVIFNYFEYFFYYDLDKLETNINDFKDQSTPKANEISNPIFKNKGLNTNFYEIGATKGVQIKNDIELYEVVGKFTNDDGELIFIKANTGIYSQNSQIIKLIEDVLIYDEFGNKTSTKSAIIDIDKKKINLSEDVVSISSNSIIKANSSLVDEKNSTIIYSGNVTVKIEIK